MAAQSIEIRKECIWEIVRSSRLPIIESDGDLWRTCSGGLERADQFDSMTDKVLDNMELGERDRTFQESIEGIEASPDERAWAIEYVEGFNAARKERIGVHALIRSQEAANRIQGDRTFRLSTGYDSLVRALEQWLPDSVSLYLGAPVRNIQWRPHFVAIDTARGRFEARKAIVKLPLGVLQGRAVRFDPDLPKKREAANGLAMGEVIRVTMCFREHFWQSGDLSKMIFLFSHDEVFRHGGACIRCMR